jgi:D-3-phosphoglycerate dehydrogenase
MMKDGAFLLNCARGGIVDEGALLKALNDGKLTGAALDVYETEPPKTDNPLFKLAQVVVTPHLGASTEEAQQNVAIEIAKQVCDCLLGRGIRNAANMPSLDASSAKTLQPYVLLCEKMGSLASQLIEAQVSQVQVIFTGEVTLYDSAPLTLAVLKGILEPVVGEGVNYVNASFIASERGIKVIESKASQMEEFANLISIEVKSGSQSMIVQGTLSSKKEPRIVRIDRYFVETTPTGFMLFIKNYDKPGLIGHVGSVLGEAGINIASMSNGRDKPGGDAITVVSVDVEVLPKVLEKIKRFEHVIDAKLIKL